VRTSVAYSEGATEKDVAGTALRDRDPHAGRIDVRDLLKRGVATDEIGVVHTDVRNRRRDARWLERLIEGEGRVPVAVGEARQQRRHSQIGHCHELRVRSL